MRPLASDDPNPFPWTNPGPSAWHNKIAFGLLIARTLGGIIRSAIATGLDSFDLDEAYHIAAGVA